MLGPDKTVYRSTRVGNGIGPCTSECGPTLITPSPMLFNKVHEQEMREGARASDYAALERRFEEATASRTAGWAASAASISPSSMRKPRILT